MTVIEWIDPIMSKFAADSLAERLRLGPAIAGAERSVLRRP
jgi:hypothetical protein